MKMAISSLTVVQLGLMMALFCVLMSSADERPKFYNRRSQGWTPQALFLYGIMPPKRQKSDVSYSTIKRTAWGPRPNIMRAWHAPRVSRDVTNFDDVDDEDKRGGWTGRSRVFGRAEAMNEKRMPPGAEAVEEMNAKRALLSDEFEQFPILKKMLEFKEKREDEIPILYEEDEFEN